MIREVRRYKSVERVKQFELRSKRQRYENLFQQIYKLKKKKEAKIKQQQAADASLVTFSQKRKPTVAMLREHREKGMAANRELSTIMGTLQQKNSLATSLERDISLVEMQGERLAATIDELSENNLQELAQLEFDDISETFVTRKYSEEVGEMISSDVNEIELLPSHEGPTSERTYSDTPELHSHQQSTEQGESHLESQLERDSEIQLEGERESEGDDDEYKQAFSEGGVRLELELDKQRLALQLRDNGRGELSLQLETESSELLRALNERRKDLIRDLHGTGHRTRDFKCRKLYK